MSDPNHRLPLTPGNGGKDKLSEDMLMQYLEGKLSAAGQHEVEQWLAEEGMESDAMEGLHTITPDETRNSVNKLNNHLRKALHQKKRKRRPLKTDYLTWTALAIILMLAVVAYILIRKII